LKHTVFILLLLTGGAALAQNTVLPDFGSPADSVMSKTQEAQIGRSVMAQLRNAGAVMEDPQVNEYVQTLGARLAGHANDGGQRFTFFMIDDPAINAFALPGGYIGVNSGLLLASASESEVAGVLAHEVAHVTQRHIARSVYDTQRNSILSMAAMLAAVILGAGAGADSEATAGLITASQAAIAQRQINFTRSNEHEADRIGIQTLSSAGFDPSGMASFFEKLARRYGISRQNIPAILQTHPVTSERIAEARDRARQLPNPDPVDSVGYGVVKARLLVLQAPTSEAAYAIFKTRLNEGSAEPADRYGLALSLTRLGRDDEAERVLSELTREYPGVIAYRIARAEATVRNGAMSMALAQYAEGVDLFPRNIPLTISYAEALMSAGQAAAAHKVLLDLLNNVPATPEQLHLIARAANAEGDIGNAHYYMSWYYSSIGNLPQAMNQLRMALESPDVNSVDRARFRARLEELIEYLPENDRRRQRELERDDPASSRWARVAH
jgi:predicted Zn-dependent protease